MIGVLRLINNRIGNFIVINNRVIRRNLLSAILLTKLKDGSKNEINIERE